MITERLQNLLRTLLNKPDYVFHDETKAFTVPGWDSLKHVEILIAIQKDYNIRFRSVEVIKLKNVGDLQVLVNNKTK